jgi:hypothetical protein
MRTHPARLEKVHSYYYGSVQDGVTLVKTKSHIVN